MARTQGHGNPKWTRDETILALNLYFELGGRIPPGNDSRVQELSELLRRFPYHANASRRESFRNPDGVAFKLQNLRQVATGRLEVAWRSYLETGRGMVPASAS